MMTSQGETSITSRRQVWERHYLDGFVPWDTRTVPPEVRLFWQSDLLDPVGITLDLGCGTGTNAAFLASLGLHAIGFDLTYNALDTALDRLNRGTYLAPFDLVQSDSSTLPITGLAACYILDVGCLHSIPRQDRLAYAKCVIENLAPGGYYHLFAHDPPDRSCPRYSDDRGLLPVEVGALFTDELALLTVCQGNPDPRKCHWYLLRKPS